MNSLEESLVKTSIAALPEINDKLEMHIEIFYHINWYHFENTEKNKKAFYKTILIYFWKYIKEFIEKEQSILWSYLKTLSKIW